MTEEARVVFETDAEAAVVATLSRAPVDAAPPRSTGPGGWTSSIAGGGPGADPATIVIQRTRVVPTCQMHAVAFRNHRGLQVEWIVRTWQEPDGAWVVAPVGGGSLGGAPRRSRPWVNFAAGFSPHEFTAGGHVEGDGSEHAVKVRLRFNGDLTMEDVVENGIVLFFEPRCPSFPAQVDIFDGRGGLLASYEEFDQGPFVG